MKLPSAFNPYASTYDQDFTFSEIGKLQRLQVWQYLKPYLKNQKNILEINCGTGHDAIQLGKAGHQVLATDLSDKMISEGQKKLKQQKKELPVSFQQVNFLELQEQLQDQQFDIIFSNFGGLNCINPIDTKLLRPVFYNLLSTNGLLFLTYMSSACLWERFYYNFKGNRKAARRRRSSDPVMAKVANSAIPIWYYAPPQLKEIFRDQFQCLQIKPIGLFVPPSYLEHYFKSKTKLLKALHKLDSLFSASIFANYADHFVIVFRKA